MSFKEPALVQTVGDEREYEEATESSEEPDPPGYSRLPGLAGNDGGCHTVGLESQMSLVNQEWEFCDSRDELRGDFHLLSIVLDLSLCKEARSDFKQYTLVLLQRTHGTLYHRAAPGAATVQLGLELCQGSLGSDNWRPLVSPVPLVFVLEARLHIARELSVQVVPHPLLQLPLDVVQVAARVLLGG